MKICKLEYLIKDMDIISRRKLIELLDKDNDFFYSKDLEESEKYSAIFTEINQICVNNNISPIFKNPLDIEECLKVREKLLFIDYVEGIDNNLIGVDCDSPKNAKSIYYPAIFKKDEEDSGWNVIVPDIFGGVTCGEDYNSAIEMAKDMIKLMLEEASGQCFPPKTFEETKMNFPDELVVMIEVEY